MTNVIPFDGRPQDAERPATTGMSALRIITGMGVDEFAEAVGMELGRPVPLYVYLEWERTMAPLRHRQLSRLRGTSRFAIRSARKRRT